MDNGFKVARRASGMTLEEVSKSCGIAHITYVSSREKNPGSFRLSELRGLYSAMPPTAQTLLVEAIDGFLRS